MTLQAWPPPPPRHPRTEEVPSLCLGRSAVIYRTDADEKFQTGNHHQRRRRHRRRSRPTWTARRRKMWRPTAPINRERLGGRVCRKTIPEVEITSGTPGRGAASVWTLTQLCKLQIPENHCDISMTVSWWARHVFLYHIGGGKVKVPEDLLLLFKCMYWL